MPAFSFPADVYFTGYADVARCYMAGNVAKCVLALLREPSDHPFGSWSACVAGASVRDRLVLSFYQFIP